MRTVPLSAQLISALKAWKVRSRFSKADDLIFPNRQGTHIGHDNLIKRQFLPLFQGAQRFNWHALRHFAVSTWIEAGLTPKTVRTLCGSCIPASHHGSIWASLPERRPQARDRSDRERAFQIGTCCEQTLLPCANHVPSTSQNYSVRAGTTLNSNNISRDDEGRSARKTKVPLSY